MANFAKIENDVVQQVISISDNDCAGGEFPYSESFGQNYIASLRLGGEWIQASYNSSFRGVFPSKGFSYDRENDRFVPPQPYMSWVLNDSFEWQPPRPYPEDGNVYRWDDAIGDWVEINFFPIEYKR